MPDNGAYVDRLAGEFETRLAELRRRRAALDVEIELTEQARARLAGQPRTPDSVRRLYAARTQRKDPTR